jgi:hypothetical protein
MSRIVNRVPALGFLVSEPDHTSPGSRVANDLSPKAEEFLRMGRRNNAGPGMVCNLAIRVPVAVQHSMSRLVSDAAGSPPRPCKLADWRTIDLALFFRRAMQVPAGNAGMACPAGRSAIRSSCVAAR